MKKVTSALHHASTASGFLIFLIEPSDSCLGHRESYGYDDGAGGEPIQVSDGFHTLDIHRAMKSVRFDFSICKIHAAKSNLECVRCKVRREAS